MFELVASAQAIHVAGTHTPPVDTTGAKLFVASVNQSSQGPRVVTDSRGNSWIRNPNNYESIYNFLNNFICFPTDVGPNHTFDSNTDRTTGMTVLAFKGDGIAFVGENGRVLGGEPPNIQPGPRTPAGPNRLLITNVGVAFSSTIAVNQGFVIREHIPHAAGSPLDTAYLIQTTPLAVDPTWSWAAGQEPSSSILEFSIPDAPSGPLPPPKGLANGVVSTILSSVAPTEIGLAFGLPLSRKNQITWQVIGSGAVVQLQRSVDGVTFFVFDILTGNDLNTISSGIGFVRAVLASNPGSVPVTVKIRVTRHNL